MFCDVDLTKLTPTERQTHYDDHLSALETLPPSKSSHPQSSHSRSSPIKGVSSSSKHSSPKDSFWYHSLESEPPSNYTPGLIPILRKVLLNSVEKGVTRRAVLCYERAVHIYRELWDAGWGCGYRNFMMACAALMDQRIQPAYSSLLGAPTLPGVNNLKVWIEEAWGRGYDPEGAQGLKGKLVGHTKWIGTAELYVAFTYRGVPSLLADFTISDGNLTPLIDWIKRYFDTHTQDHSTVSVQERWRAATSVVITDRMPIILQHQGHSRTIVGYEITRDGTTNLLAFDPSTRMAHIRDIALFSFNLSRGREAHPDRSKPSTPRRLVESLEKLSHSRNKRIVGPSAGEPKHSPTKRLRAGSHTGDDVIILEDSEPEGSAPKAMRDRDNSDRGRVTNWVRMRAGGDEKALDPKKVLTLFRVNQKRLAKKDKHQVLWFPMEDPLTELDKHARREVISVRVC
ncbi:peptidase family C78-domain-containing protein [Lactifluus subvellereus]|nr:peptidase family C78-domain-containing protein [Lactifluus subvellereus]